MIRATPGVGTMPTQTASRPVDAMPATSAASSIVPERRVSRPTTIAALCAPSNAGLAAAAARPMRKASSGVSVALATPRTPSVPKIRPPPKPSIALRFPVTAMRLRIRCERARDSDRPRCRRLRRRAHRRRQVAASRRTWPALPATARRTRKLTTRSSAFVGPRNVAAAGADRHRIDHDAMVWICIMRRDRQAALVDPFDRQRDRRRRKRS